MLVQNKHLTTIWYEQNNDKIKIIDQRFIPFELKIVELNTVDEVLKHALTKTLKPVKWAEINQSSAKGEATSRH